jgi:tape measure domain-containing protein
VSNIDERIVEMTFKSGEFVKNVDTTVSALQRLKEKLNFKGAGDSLNQLDQAGKHVNLSGLTQAADNVGRHFSAMSVVAYSAIANITNRAVNAGISIIKALTVDPIKAGLDVYETKINAIQTILANTQAEGTNLKQVTAALNELNIYANKTVFSFADMTKNIGTFTAAGVNLKTSVASIKGIANLAALSGSSADQASNAMYQLSQAIAAGTVKLQDWNSVVNAGLGGKTFQTALINTARATGVSIDAIIKKAGSFRNSLQQGWLTSDILTKTLSQFTGDLSKKQIQAMGFTSQEADNILKLGKTAVASAVNIRTTTQLMAALKEEVATAWSRVWETLIGNINGATSTLTSLHNVLENFFTKPINDLNTFLQEFVKLGGRTDVINIIKFGLKDIMSVLGPIKSAFRDIFPPATATSLIVFVINLEQFVQKLKLSKTAGEELRKTFDGVFSILKIGIDIIKAIFGGLGQIGSATGKASGGILGFTAKIGDFLVKLQKAIESGGILTKIFDTLGKVLSLPVKLLGLAGGGMNAVGAAAQKATGFLRPFIDGVKNAFEKLGSIIQKAIQSGDLNNLAQLLNQGIFASILLAIRKFFTSAKDAEPKKGLFATIKESFDALTGTLKTMQANLKSDILLKIAAAVGILTVSIVALSLIKPANLGRALGAISGMFIELLAAMAIITKISAGGGIIKMAAIGVALNLLAASMVTLSVAVTILSRLSWSGIAKGLATIGGLLASLVAFAALSGGGKILISTAIAMNGIAIAINLLAIAVEHLGRNDLATLAKGIGAIAVLLTVLAGFNAISGTQTIATATALLILGGALNIIAKVIEDLGSFSLSALAKGVGAVAAALVLIAIAMNLMPPSMVLTAAGLVLVSLALLTISKAMQNFGGMSWSQVGRGLVVLAGSLILIALATAAMTEALPGAAALLVVAGALAILAPILVLLGQQSWGNIAKGLAALAGVFVILGLAGLLLAPVVPVLVALGAAILLLGVGIAAAGAGIALFAAGLGALAVAGGAAITVIVASVSELLGLIPLAFTELGKGIIALANVIGQGGPAIVKAIVAVLSALLDAIIKIVPKAVKAFETLLTGILQLIVKDAPRIIEALVKLVIEMLTVLTSRAPAFSVAAAGFIVAMLNGVQKNLGKVVTAGTNVVIAFINSVANNALRITQAGANAIIRFVNGLANQIRADTPRMDAAGRNLAEAIVQGMVDGLLTGIGTIGDIAVQVAENALNRAKQFLHINSPSLKFRDEVGAPMAEGMAVGLLQGVDQVSNSAKSVANSALTALQESLSGVKDLVSNNLNLQPTITPVLNLSTLRSGLNGLQSLTKNQLISASVSSNTATSISNDNAAAAAASAKANPSGVTNNLTFNQTNNSPVALDAGTIYRQTKNQLTAVKGRLPTSANAS